MSSVLPSVARSLWWTVLVRGIVAIVFGIIAILAPGAALTGIAVVYGIYVLVDGVASISQAVRSRPRNRRWWWLLAGGILSVIAGIVVLVFPGLAGTLGGIFVLWTIAIFSIVHGATLVMSAAGASGSRGRGFGIISGVLTIIVGVLLAVMLFVTPGATVLGLVWIVGIYAVIFGIVLVVVSLQVRSGATKALR